MISLHSCSQKEKKIETFHSGIGFVYNLDLCTASNKADEEHCEFELSKLKPGEWIDFFFQMIKANQSDQHRNCIISSQYELIGAI